VSEFGNAPFGLDTVAYEIAPPWIGSARNAKNQKIEHIDIP
jgi:hypothetical protein